MFRLYSYFITSVKLSDYIFTILTDSFLPHEMKYVIQSNPFVRLTKFLEAKKHRFIKLYRLLC